MPAFSYEAINQLGKKTTGTVEAESPALAERQLVDRGYIPIKVTPAGLGGRIGGLWEGVKPADLIIFTKQFHSMIKAGVPILRILQVLENQTQNRALKGAVTQIHSDIKQGATLGDSLEKHPRIFSPLYRSMIRAGEVSGTVPAVLARLTYIIEHEAKIKADIKAALQYPTIVLAALVAAFFVLLTFVIPKFVAIFASAGLALPVPTKIAVGLYIFLSSYWFLALGLVISLAFGLSYYLKSPQGRYVFDNLILRSPILGQLFLKAAMSRFSSIFAILYSSGIHVMTALDILSETIGNRAISREIERLREDVKKGQGLAQPLRRSRYFTPMVIDMIAIGEESGSLEEMLKEVTAHYDYEVSYEVKGLSEALGPVLMVGLAAVVGFFALAIFLPMWDMTKMAK